MLAYLVLLLAVLSRMLPPLMHLTAMNFTAVGGSLLFFGAKRPRWQAGVAVGAMMMTDYLLTVYAYGFAFHVSSYLATWAWYAGVVLLGHRILSKVSVGRVAAGVLGSATSFFLISNFVVWMGSLYAHTLAGLGACYAAALPFYRNDLVSTALVAGCLFGLPALAARMVHTASPRGQAAL
jgi:hypothetical protein